MVCNSGHIYFSLYFFFHYRSIPNDFFFVNSFISFICYLLYSWFVMNNYFLFRGILLHGRERYDEAIESYQLAVRFRPSLARKSNAHQLFFSYLLSHSSSSENDLAGPTPKSYQPLHPLGNSSESCQTLRLVYQSENLSVSY